MSIKNWLECGLQIEDEAREHQHDERTDASHAAQDPEHLNKRTVAYIAKALEAVTAEDIHNVDYNFDEEVADIDERDYDFGEEEAVSP